MNNAILWTTRGLFEDIKATDLVKSDDVSINLIEGTDPTIHLIMHEFGELPIYLTVAGEQILVESLMWPIGQVKDTANFNEEVLRTHKLFPLSTICLDKMADGEEYYCMFGALSARSSLWDIVLEIETLADNAIKVAEAYQDFLNPIN